MKTELNSELITDSQALSGAKTRFGSAIQTYDDGFGPLWILRDSMGITGIIRARTWEDAYGIAEDEMFPEADDTIDALEKEYGENWMEHPCFQEAYGFRPNGPNDRDSVNHGIYAKDLNGDYLDRLTDTLLSELGITLDLETCED